jgi:hypothetical protein
LASALVGDALFGLFGALLGGLSGSSTTSSRVSELALRIIVEDRVIPVYVVTFFRNGARSGSSANGFVVKQAREHLERMHAHMMNIMRTAQGERATQPVLSNATSSANIASLQKLWELKEKGGLTEAEFLQQKTLLLQNTAGVGAPQSAPPPLLDVNSPARCTACGKDYQAAGGFCPHCSSGSLAIADIKFRRWNLVLKTTTTDGRP